jgi:hypothetical protein
MVKVTKAKRGRPPTEDALGGMLGVRVSSDDLARLDAIVSRMMLGSRHAVARAALRLGLDAIERDPGVLLGQKPKIR